MKPIFSVRHARRDQCSLLIHKQTNTQMRGESQSLNRSEECFQSEAGFERTCKGINTMRAAMRQARSEDKGIIRSMSSEFDSTLIQQVGSDQSRCCRCDAPIVFGP